MCIACGRSAMSRSRSHCLYPPGLPSAVLPFDNRELSTGGIITGLARFRSLFVIARNSSFAFRSKPVDLTEIARRLGEARYGLGASSEYDVEKPSHGAWMGALAKFVGLDFDRLRPLGSRAWPCLCLPERASLRPPGSWLVSSGSARKTQPGASEFFDINPFSAYQCTSGIMRRGQNAMRKSGRHWLSSLTRVCE